MPEAENEPVGEIEVRWTLTEGRSNYSSEGPSMSLRVAIRHADIKDDETFTAIRRGLFKKVYDACLDELERRRPIPTAAGVGQMPRPDLARPREDPARPGERGYVPPAAPQVQHPPPKRSVPPWGGPKPPQKPAQQDRDLDPLAESNWPRNAVQFRGWFHKLDEQCADIIGKSAKDLGYTWRRADWDDDQAMHVLREFLERVGLVQSALAQDPGQNGKYY